MPAPQPSPPRPALDPAGVAARWQYRQSLLADLSRLNGWSRTTQAAAQQGFSGQGNISTLKLQANHNELAWETPPIPLEGTGDTVTFHWKHGAQVGCWSTAEDHRQNMTLHFNGKPLLKFGLDLPDREWTASGGRRDAALPQPGPSPNSKPPAS